MRIDSLILLVTACHSAGGQPPRAPQVSGGVIVRVFQGKDVSPGNDTPATDVVVVAHAPDGTAVGVARMNQHGEARFADFPSGGAVTIAEPHSAATSLHTVFGVHPGDVIDFSVEEQAVLPRGWLSSQWKLYPGAVGYQFFDGCNTTSLTLRETQRLEVDDRCLSPWRSVSAIVYALDGGGHHLAYATVTGVSLEKGTGTRLALGPWSTDFVDVRNRLPGRLRRPSGCAATMAPVATSSPFRSGPRERRCPSPAGSSMSRVCVAWPLPCPPLGSTPCAMLGF